MMLGYAPVWIYQDPVFLQPTLHKQFIHGEQFEDHEWVKIVPCRIL